MCEACEARELDEMVGRLRCEIATQGWTITGLEPEPGDVPWVYTVGLAASHQHPELVVAGLPALAGELLIDLLARRVTEGERFDHESTVELGELDFTFGWVHPRHFERGVLDLWQPLMEQCTNHLRPQAIQVFPPVSPYGDQRSWSLATPPRNHRHRR